MTTRERPLCDCPEPCGCYAEGYAAGKDVDYLETITRRGSSRELSIRVARGVYYGPGPSGAVPPSGRRPSTRTPD